MLNNNNQNEVWKPFPEFETLYEVSNTGRVRSISEYRKYTKHRIKKLNPRSDTCAYLHATLSNKGTSHRRAVHRAVAIAFIPKVEGKNIVNHIDGDKHNNKVSNLEWVTMSENHKHAFALGLKKPSKSQTGNKCGTTSKYHNVGFDSSRNKWKISIKVDGVMRVQKRFGSEKEAALAVNYYLDELGIHDRPRNDVV